MSNSEWVKKLQLDVEENEDGTWNILLTWDEKDPELQLWSELGKEKQTALIWDALARYVKNLTGEDLSTTEQKL